MPEIKLPSVLFRHGDQEQFRIRGTCPSKTGAEAFVSFFIHTNVIVRNAQDMFMTTPFKERSCLKTAAIIIKGDIEHPLRVLTISVIYDKRDPHMISQIMIILITEADDHKPVHVPHRGEGDDLFRIFCFLDHHKAAVFFDL